MLGNVHNGRASVAYLKLLKLRVVDAFPAGRYPTLETLSAACQALPEFAATVPAADETMPPRGTGVA